MFNVNNALHASGSKGTVPINVDPSIGIRYTQKVSDAGWLKSGHGSYRMTESNWRQVEHDQARRERRRLIRTGAITPAEHIRPQLMIKTESGWMPEIRRHV